jgi:MFS transporter, PPP family, 3-phenylpropionic acid transporter
LISLALAVIRFAMIGLVPENLVLLLIAQSLHAFTFGSFHAASIEVVSQFFNGRHQAKGQAIYNSVAYGVGGTVGGLAGGFAMEFFGGAYTFMMAAAFPLLGFVVIAFGLKLSKPYAKKGMFND